MTGSESEPTELLRRAGAGDAQALHELFTRYRDRLRWMVRLRLSQRLQGRVDPSDVVNEAFLEVGKGLPNYLQKPALPFFLWLRHITGRQLVAVHRRHLSHETRDVEQEVSLYRGALPEACSASLAAQLLGRVTSASRAAERAEAQLQVQAALNQMERSDREILALRHFEMLSN